MSTIAPISPARAGDQQHSSAPLVSVVIPCLNEAENIEACVGAARTALSATGMPRRGGRRRQRLRGRLAPRSPQGAGARVVLEPRRGYGSAYLAGFAAARGSYIVMADADLTYDFNEIPRFVARARGRRRAGDGRPHGQHPARARCRGMHRYVGNPVLTGLLNLFFRTGISRRALRHARAAPRRAAARSTCARPAWSSPPRW